MVYNKDCLALIYAIGIKNFFKGENENEKNEILDKLFPGHGQIFGGGDGLFTIIGTVDLDGNNYINARVHFNASSLVHLKDSVFVASNVEFRK